MARKVTVSKSNTIQTWMQKVNQMSDYIEDLDDLDTTFDSGGSGNDKSIVVATNYLYSIIDIVNNQLFGGSGSPNLTAKIVADSGGFNKLHVDQLWNYDSAMPGPGIDDSDYLWFGDSVGTNKFDYNSDSTAFGTLTITNLEEMPDSATFGKLVIRDSGFINYLHNTNGDSGNISFGTLDWTGVGEVDSMQIEHLHIIDSGSIGSITTSDSTAVLIIKNMKIISGDYIDSALVLNTIRIDNFISDSGLDSGFQVPKVTVEHAYINTLYLDSEVIDTVRPFLLTDSLGYDSPNQGDSGTIFFAGYQLDSS